MNHSRKLLVFFTVIWFCIPANGDDLDSWYYHEGNLAGSLKSDKPLPIYDADPQHLWNRLFAAFYIRKIHLPVEPKGKPITRIEGGDYIDFFGWGRTTYWSSPNTTKRLNKLLDEFLNKDGHKLISDPLKRAVLLRDLWAAYDFLTGQNIKRFGSVETRKRRDLLCGKLAKVIESLTLTQKEINTLPDNYAAAVKSKAFLAEHNFDPKINYLPVGLLTQPDEWAEIDFRHPDIHEDLSLRLVTMHTREYRGRSYFRIFYRFPKGRKQLTAYLAQIDKNGVDWRTAAQNGFIFLKKDVLQIPVGTEVALLQFMMTLDKQLRPSPTPIVESIRLRTFPSVDGSDGADTNTGLGMNVMEYTLKRSLLFDNLKHGGLHREPDDLGLYRVIIQPDTAPDWGTVKRKVLHQQCADCHTSPKGDRTGVHSMPSIVHMGGFGVGAQVGIVHPLTGKQSDLRGKRAARWKTQHETYRRMLDHLGR
jgi:hypothetical protein